MTEKEFKLSERKEVERVLISLKNLIQQRPWAGQRAEWEELVKKLEAKLNE
jgi:hypothetical protein